MEDGWLEQADLLDDWIEVINPDGDTLGWIERRRTIDIGLHTQVIETPERYLRDPYVRYHAKLAYERGLFTGGQDLNDIQIVLLGSQITKNREAEEKLRTRRFEEDMLINNPDLFRTYYEKKTKKDEMDEVTAGVEERVPTSVEEFLAAIAAFSEDEGAGSSKEQEGAEGWLTSLLSDDDLDQMSDD